MNNILLAQPILEDSWQDLSVGEPHLVRDILLDEVDINQIFPHFSSTDFIYPSPCGYDKLVQKLEDKHQAKVVVTTGAKQGLGAALYAVKKSGRNTLGLRSPHWALLPALAELHNLTLNYHNGIVSGSGSINPAELVVSPNNPDGIEENLKLCEQICASHGTLMIHDAAYYTKIYTPIADTKVWGDVQVYSISKMFGLSSLRLGYVVCKNDQMYQDIQYYMEHMTVGVSRPSQMLLLSIMNNIDMNRFESRCYQALEENKNIVKKISDSVLEISPDNAVGMFLWAKVKDYDAFKKAKLYIIDGEPFGKKGFVRINLALPKETIQEVVHKLNNSVNI